MLYRPEIDGLRAVAVVPVILFHAGFDQFSGGYVGVDIFFVISGFLITSIILTERSAGSFSYLNFYERRARRILPALFLVVIACIPFAWLWMQPRQFEDFGQSIMAVGLFGSNFLFWKEDGYFAEAAELKPLLHTWSLAVEEQYYVIFPLLIGAIWTFGRRRIMILLALLSFASLGLCEWMAYSYPSANFYLLPTRAWELFFGGLCAFYQTSAQRQKPSEWLSVAGTLLILYALFRFDAQTPFPSLYAVIPVIGTALIILYGRKGTYVAKLLSFGPVVAIGLISYSAYLWHQPLFAFARIRSQEDLAIPALFSLILMAFALAYVSWRFVERPFRNRRQVSGRTIAIAGASVGFLLIAVGGAGDITSGFPGRTFAENRSYEDLSRQLESNNGLSSLCDRKFTLAEECRTAEKPEIVVWGDSYAMHLIDGIIGSNPEVRLVQMTKSVCGPFFGIAPILPPLYPKKWAAGCLAFNRDVLDWMKATPSLKYAVLSTPFTTYIKNDASFLTQNGEIIKPSGIAEVQKFALAQFRETLSRLQEIGIRPVVFSPPPQSGLEIGQCLAKSALFNLDTSNCDFSFAEYRASNANVFEFLVEIDKDYDVVWLNDFICDGATCKASLGDVFIYRDTGHLSHEGSRLVGKEMDFYNRIAR